MKHYLKLGLCSILVLGTILLSMMAVNFIMPMSPMLPMNFEAEYQKIK